VEPIHPGTRAALKQAHPGLTDEDIDQYENLVSRRFQLHPERDVQEIAALDRERLELLQARMPHYEAVVRQVAAERSRLPHKPEVRIEPRRQ
jgi:hypothetical protein